MIQIEMEMPEGCNECRFETDCGFCKAMPANFCGNTIDGKRPEWCPLKEQEPKLVKIDRNRGVLCPSCGNELFTYPQQKFCDECGQAVKWNERTS